MLFSNQTFSRINNPTFSYLLILHTYPPMKMEQTECSETSAYKIQTPGNYSEESIQHSEHGESLKSRNIHLTVFNCVIHFPIFVNNGRWFVSVSITNNNTAFFVSTSKHFVIWNKRFFFFLESFVFACNRPINFATYIIYSIKLIGSYQGRPSVKGQN